MKIRTDFVTNSSSSSFIISLKDITAEQLTKIDDVVEIAEELKLCNYDCAYDWDISIGKDSVSGWTSMDNFSMYEFLETIGVDMNKVSWDDY